MNWKNNNLLIVFIFLLNNQMVSQENLINNGGFEEYTKIPTLENQMDLCKGWSSPVNSSDYFHQQSKKGNKVNIPNTFLGYKDCIEGESFVGLTVFDKNYGFKEYIQTKLLKPLIKDSLYRVEFLISIANNSTYNPQKQISFALTDTSLINKVYEAKNENMHIYYDRKGYSMIDYDKAIVVKFDSLYKVKDSIYEWKRIKFNYKSNGNEKFLTIGVFKNNVSRWSHFFRRFFIRKLNKSSLTDGAYVFIDDISLKHYPPLQIDI